MGQADWIIDEITIYSPAKIEGKEEKDFLKKREDEMCQAEHN